MSVKEQTHAYFWIINITFPLLQKHVRTPLGVKVSTEWLKGCNDFTKKDNLTSAKGYVQKVQWKEFCQSARSTTAVTLTLNHVNNYRLQRRWAKVMFLQASVILSTGGVCLPQEQTPPGSRHPPEQAPLEQTPPGSRHPPGADTPGNRHPPGADTPPGSRHP